MIRTVYHVLSMGAGVNSTALLYFLLDNKYPLDEIVFADTKGERPETYTHIEQMKRFIQTIRVKQSLIFTTLSKGSLENHCIESRISPSRRLRWCSCRFKRDIIQKHVKPYSPVIMYIGIAYDEFERMRDSNVSYIKTVYPLVENRIDRHKCVKIILKHTSNIPIKSGCFYCPFQPIRSWRDLYLDHPALYNRAQAIEEIDKHFPKHLLSKKPLRRLKTRFGAGSRPLTDFIDPVCVSGYCMT